MKKKRINIIVVSIILVLLIFFFALGTNFFTEPFSFTGMASSLGKITFTILSQQAEGDVKEINLPEGIFEPLCCPDGTTGENATCNSSMTSSEDVYCSGPKQGDDLPGSHPHTIRIVFKNLTIESGHHYCNLTQSNGSILTLNDSHGNLTNEDLEINYTLGINDSIDRTKPWHLTGCSTGKNKEDFFNSSLHYPVYVHSNTWTKFESAKDDASRALDCYATIPGKYFDNKVQCTIEGDLNYVLAMVNGYTIQTGSQCHDNKSNYGQPKDCSYDYCTGIPYWSCPDSTNISKYYENHISLEGYDYPYKDPCDVDANICWGTLDLGGGYTVDFTYTKTAQPNGRFKVKFDHGNVNTNNYVTNYITNTLPPFDDYGQYDIDDKYPSYGSGIGLPDNETASGVYKTYFDGEDGSLQGNLNHIMWVNFSNAEQKTHGLELISVYEGYQNTPEKVYATVDTNAPGNLNESDSALYHNISFIQGTQTSDHACNDGFDNDLDYGTDCKDSDCVGVKIGETLGGDGIKCESTETTCWDGFDNDDNGLVDCEDPACQDKIGAYLDNSGIPIKYDTGNTEVKCENLEGGNYYSSTPSSCNDNFDNDADNQAWGAGISCNGTYSDCRGTNIDCFDPYNCWGRGGLSGTCPFRETNCNDNFDNDYDADIVGTSGNWQGLFIPDSSPEEDLGGYDCDDYDCSGSSNCASDETLLPNGTQNLSQCFDGIDNDLDKYYWNESKGEYVRNTSTGIDCSDPSCLGVTNPDNSLEGCYEREFYLGYYDLARNGRDDDHDLDAGFNERNVADCSDNQFSRDNYSKRATNVNDLQYTDAWAKYQVCGPCPAIENYTYDSCADNFDNDYDDGEGGYAPYGGGEDCSDSDCLNELATYSGTRCVESGEENTPELCSDGKDNDGDSSIDHEDSSCFGVSINGNTIQETESDCSDSFDNDYDSYKDCIDNNCYGEGSCPDPGNDWSNGPCLNVPSLGGGSISSSDPTIYYEHQQREYINNNYTLTLTGDDDYNSVTFYIGSCSTTEFSYNKSLCSVQGPDSSSFSWTPDTGCNAGTVSLETEIDSISNFEVSLVCKGKSSEQTNTYPLETSAEYSSGGTEYGLTNVSTVWHENQDPVVNEIHTGGAGKGDESIDINYNEHVDFMAIPDDSSTGNSGICKCQFDVNSSTVWSDNYECIARQQNIKKDNTYTVRARARDGSDNIGDYGPTRTISVDVKPIDVTSSYKIQSPYHNNSITQLDVGEYKFATGGGEWGDSTCNLEISNSSGDVVLTETISKSINGDYLSCSGTVNISDISSNDGVYFASVNVIDDDGDSVTSKNKTFFVCNDLSSSGTTSSGLKWTCKKADFDNDGATEGLTTTLYNSIGNINLSCDSCPGVENTGKDADGDGIDAACDPDEDTGTYSVNPKTPSQGQTGVSTSPVLNVSVIDNDGGDDMNVSFYDAGDDSLIGTDFNVPNGSYASTTWSNLSKGTAYSWYAIVTDGTKTGTYGGWTFNTESDDEDDTGDDGSGGGGGGGGGGLTAPAPSCDEDWDCSEWSVCYNFTNKSEEMNLSKEELNNITTKYNEKEWNKSNWGFQIRDCIDTNNCNTTEEKPSEIRTCYYSEEATCDDGIRNCHDGSCEEGVDCGGPCEPCEEEKIQEIELRTSVVILIIAIPVGLLIYIIIRLIPLLKKEIKKRKK